VGASPHVFFSGEAWEKKRKGGSIIEWYPSTKAAGEVKEWGVNVGEAAAVQQKSRKEKRQRIGGRSGKAHELLATERFRQTSRENKK